MEIRRQARTLQVLKTAYRREPGVFSISSHRQLDYYLYAEIDCEIGGRGFLLWKYAGPIFHCRIGTELAHLDCDCLGFLLRNHCRHLDALRKLAALGELKLGEDVPCL